MSTLLMLIVIAAAVWLFFAYNKLRALAENVKRCQANIAATVRKRQDIAQRLLEIARAYGDHEKLMQLTIAEGDNDTARITSATADVSRVVGNVQMLANRFPELKANATYQQLMVQLDALETDVMQRREAYNGAAQAYNATRSSLPHLFYADALGFREAPYFTVDHNAAEALPMFTTDDGKIMRDTMSRMASKAGEGAQAIAGRVRAAADTRSQRSNEAAASGANHASADTTASEDAGAHTNPPDHDAPSDGPLDGPAGKDAN